MFGGYPGWLYSKQNLYLEGGKGGLPLLQIQRLVSSGAEYTPLETLCQYVVAIFFFNAIECAI
jgi:hypothetical protein